MVFVAAVNPVTKKVEWVDEDDETYGFEDEVALSMFGDMLHDTDRNEKYREAIARTMQNAAADSLVLDIGTGTGLLGLFAAQAGAKEVIGCELFEPMAEVARQVIGSSNFHERMRVVGKRSTDLTVGPGRDLPRRADILVAELVDTELIGEGCLPTYRDAHKRLLTPNATLVPYGATVVAQLVSSERLWAGHKAPMLPGMTTPLPACPGTPQCQNIQASTYNDLVYLSEPFKALEIDFRNLPPSDKEDCQSNNHVTIVRSGAVQAVLFWWVMHLDEETDISMVPGGQWRDHWMQAVCFMPEEISVQSGDTVTVAATHDDYCLWFGVQPSVELSPLPVAKPDCVCDAHRVWSFSRIAMLNDSHRLDVLTSAIQSIVTKSSVCLCLSDGALPALIAAFRIGCPNVYAVEDTSASRRMLMRCVEVDKDKWEGSGKMTIIGKSLENVTNEDTDGQAVDVVLAEPYFMAAILPWQNVYLWYAKQQLSSLLSPRAVVMPCRGVLRGAAIHTQDLWKSHDNMTSVSGLDLQPFQALLNQSGGSRGGVHVYQMAEYVYTSMTEEMDLLTFEFSTPVHDMTVETEMQLTTYGVCHGVLLWMDYELCAGHWLSTSPVAAPYMKQAVYMLPKSVHVAEGAERKTRLTARTQFDMTSGDVKFDFSIREAGVQDE